MKQVIVVLALVCCFKMNPSWGQSTSTYFNDKDSSYFTGKISGFKPGQGDEFISFSTYGVDGRIKKHSFQVLPDGTFTVAVLQNFAGDISINYKNAFVSLYTKPGAHLKIQIQDNAIETGKKYKDVFTVTGELGDLNNLLLDFQSAIHDHDFVHQSDIGDKQQTDSAFAANRIKRLEEELLFLDDFVNSRNVRNEQFVSWQKNQLIYSAGSELVLFLFFGKINKDITQEKFLKLITTIPIANLSALHNSDYYTFLSGLAGGHEIMAGINPAYKALKEECGNNALLASLKLVDKVAVGLTREIMYCGRYLSKFETPYKENIRGSKSDIFVATVQDPVLHKIVNRLRESIETGFETYNIVNRIRDLKVNEELKTRLIAVFENAQGSNIFIDFWAEWCAPCMMEMPSYPELISKFEDKPIKFIFFSTKTKEESVKRVKEKYKINADFINLTNDEVSIMNTVFGFHSYPSHFLVNDKGMVVANHTKKAEDIDRLLFNQTSKL